MMKLVTLVFLLFLSNQDAYAQSEEHLIREALLRYINGTSLNNPEMIADAFYDDAYLFLSKEGQEIWLMPVWEYADLFNRGERGQPNGREGEILSIDQQNDIALAKAEIRIPARSMRFIDVFILKRLSGEWKIISKAATQIE